MASGRSKILISVALLWALLWSVQAAAQKPQKVERNDFHVPGEPGIALFVRELRIPGQDSGVPIVLIHGARVPGLASFDLEVPGGSLAADLAAGGHRVYVMDVRGYGGSTRPGAMDDPPAKHAPLVRHDDAVRDIDAVVDWARRKSGAQTVALFGWATGGSWAGMYAGLHADKVSHLILLNSLYASPVPHPLLAGLADPEHPGRFDPKTGAYTLAPEASILRPWDASIADADKATWRDPAVADAYVKAALASDPTSGSRTPPSMRSPAGALEDSFYQANGQKLWSATFIQAETLIIRSERDFWSSCDDVVRLAGDLVHARRAKVVFLPGGATHMVHLDRPEHGRNLLISTVLEFVRAS